MEYNEYQREKYCLDAPEKKQSFGEERKSWYHEMKLPEAWLFS